MKTKHVILACFLYPQLNDYIKSKIHFRKNPQSLYSANHLRKVIKIKSTTEIGGEKNDYLLVIVDK